MVTNRYAATTPSGAAVFLLHMKSCSAAGDGAHWAQFDRSAASVRAGDCQRSRGSHPWTRLARSGAGLALLGGVTVIALQGASGATPVHADGAADGALFSLVNQDRSSNGVRSLNGNGTLQNIGEAGRYGGCPGLTVYGRSLDMIQRNYFAHPILGCGQVVFSMMRAFGLRYNAAGENIGWNLGGAASINSAFMNSADHRANILNGNYTDLGVGSATSGATAWTGGGGSWTNAWMFSEEFAQLGSSPPPPPPPPPPKPRPTAGPQPPRNNPAPNAPVLPPATTAAPTAEPTPEPTATPLPTPTPLPSLTLPPPLAAEGGLLFNAVESVLENFLIN